MGKIFNYTIGVLTLGYLYFNRNPVPYIPKGNNIISPSSGTVVDIKNNIEGNGIAIEIFINIWDIHYQRSPVDGQIVNIENQSPMYSLIEIESSNPSLGHITIERWAGELARSITTFVKPNQYIIKGQVLGRILLGSHTAITVPPYLLIKVKTGQHVEVGETIIAQWKSKPKCWLKAVKRIVNNNQVQINDEAKMPTQAIAQIHKPEPAVLFMTENTQGEKPN